jgi:uncharacterized protein
VCLSGGVDSAVLAAAAHRTLRDKALAVTGVSASLAAQDRVRARRLCEDLGLGHLEVATDELAVEGYAANTPQRCFFCKSELFDRVRSVLPETHREASLLEGTHLDDLQGHRPGFAAAQGAGVLSPYVELRWRKVDVRDAARALGLSEETAQRPSAPCLSSRLPFGTRVTPERLAQIEAAESLLHRLGYAACRVRHHGEIARIELPVAQIAAFMRRDAAVVAARLREIGFVYTTVDVLGLRSGSLHEALQPRGEASTT